MFVFTGCKMTMTSVILLLATLACVALAGPVGVWTDQAMWDLAKSRINKVSRKGGKNGEWRMKGRGGGGGRWRFQH